MDYVCIDYPLVYLILAGLDVITLVTTGGTASGDLILHLVRPFMLILWLVIGAGVYRKGYELSLRFGVWTETSWNLLLLVTFVGLCLLWANLAPEQFIQVPLGYLIVYQLAWVVGTQWWQNTRYNRYARNHPWREQPQQ